MSWWLEFFMVLVIIRPKDEPSWFWFKSVLNSKLHLFTHNYATIMIIFITDQLFLLRNHSEKFSENWITFNASPHIKSPLEIHVYAYKWLKTIGIVMKFVMKMYFVNLNYITKFSYGIIIGSITKICLAIIIGLKILLP